MLLNRGSKVQFMDHTSNNKLSTVGKNSDWSEAIPTGMANQVTIAVYWKSAATKGKIIARWYPDSSWDNSAGHEFQKGAWCGMVDVTTMAADDPHAPGTPCLQMKVMPPSIAGYDGFLRLEVYDTDAASGVEAYVLLSGV